MGRVNEEVEREKYLSRRQGERERYLLKVARYFSDSDVRYTPEALRVMVIPRLNMLIEQMTDVNKQRIADEEKQMAKRDKMKKKSK